jgi:hypothetical protein
MIQDRQSHLTIKLWLTRVFYGRFYCS